MPVLYEITLEGFPEESFAEGDTFRDAEGVDHVIPGPDKGGAEKAWDAYKAKHLRRNDGGKMRRVLCDKRPKVVTIDPEAEPDTALEPAEVPEPNDSRSRGPRGG
jgi:hypothetical protein